MSIYRNGDYHFIDHNNIIKKIYSNVTTSEGTVPFILIPNLFSIRGDKGHGSNRKRLRKSDELHEEAMIVKCMYEKFINSIPSNIKQDIMCKYKLLDTSEVRNLSKQLFESTIFDHTGIVGGNNSDVPIKCKVQEYYFLLPSRSRFYCGCVKEQCVKLNGSKFDIVIADPPWWNKYIRRLKSANDKLSYSMMYNEDIASIPIKNILSENCLIAVWCTNAPSNIAAVKDLIFPNWGVEYITTWYWLKVTVDLKPVCGFSSGCKKQPYERLILGKVGKVKNVPDSQLYVSVPSALHSHKPPLLDILSQYVHVERPKTLELFARYLLPDTTSVGYEPLKWQHISLYEAIT